MPIRTVTPQELKKLLEQQPNLPLIDVRTPGEFRGAHLIGAENLPLNRLSDQIETVASKHKDDAVYFICKGGVRSRSACEKALAHGLSKVVNVEGGTDSCIAAGLPIERGAKAFSPARIVAGGLVLIGAALAFGEHPYLASLAALIGVGLVFSGVAKRTG
jgi:rhodanese-related sulfurtransferase